MQLMLWGFISMLAGGELKLSSNAVVLHFLQATSIFVMKAAPVQAAVPPLVVLQPATVARVHVPLLRPAHVAAEEPHHKQIPFLVACPPFLRHRRLPKHSTASLPHYQNELHVHCSMPGTRQACHMLCVSRPSNAQVRCAVGEKCLYV